MTGRNAATSDVPQPADRARKWIAGAKTNSLAYMDEGRHPNEAH